MSRYALFGNAVHAVVVLMTADEAHSWLGLLCIKVDPKAWFPKLCVCYPTLVRMIFKLCQLTSEREQDGFCKMICSNSCQLLNPVSRKTISRNLDSSFSTCHLTHVWADFLLEVLSNLQVQFCVWNNRFPLGLTLWVTSLSADPSRIGGASASAFRYAGVWSTGLSFVWPSFVQNRKIQNLNPVCWRNSMKNPWEIVNTLGQKYWIPSEESKPL